MIPKRDPLDFLAMTARRSGLWVPTPLRMGWWPCGCCEKCECLTCNPTAVSCSYAAVFTGFVNADCSDCTYFNDESGFVLSFVGGGVLCTWDYLLPVAKCGVHHIRFESNVTLGDYRFRVSLQTVSYAVLGLWQKSHGASAPDCQVTDYDIPFILNNGLSCDISASTCLLSAI